MNTLKVNDNNRYTVDTLYQWDINQELFIYGLNIIKPEIHFANEVMSSSLVVRGVVDSAGVITVKIPNSLLQKPYPITAYICGYEGSTFKTYCRVIIPIKKRKKPGDYTIETTDGEVYSFLELSRKISDLENSIEEKTIVNFFSYTYDSSKNKLNESSGTYTVSKSLGLVSSSLKAIKTVIDKFKTLIDSNTSNVNTLNTNTTKLLKDVSTLSTKVTALEESHTGVEVWTNSDINSEFGTQTISLDLSGYSKIRIIFYNYWNESRDYYIDSICSVQNYNHAICDLINFRIYSWSENGVFFDDCMNATYTMNDRIIPYKIIAYK